MNVISKNLIPNQSCNLYKNNNKNTNESKQIDFSANSNQKNYVASYSNNELTSSLRAQSLIKSKIKFTGRDDYDDDNTNDLEKQLAQIQKELARVKRNTEKGPIKKIADSIVPIALLGTLAGGGYLASKTQEPLKIFMEKFNNSELVDKITNNELVNAITNNGCPKGTELTPTELLLQYTPNKCSSSQEIKELWKLKDDMNMYLGQEQLDKLKTC